MKRHRMNDISNLPRSLGMTSYHGLLHDRIYKGEPFKVVSSILNHTTKRTHIRIEVYRNDGTKDFRVIDDTGKIIL